MADFVQDVVEAYNETIDFFPGVNWIYPHLTVPSVGKTVVFRKAYGIFKPIVAKFFSRGLPAAEAELIMTLRCFFQELLRAFPDVLKYLVKQYPEAMFELFMKHNYAQGGKLITARISSAQVAKAFTPTAKWSKALAESSTKIVKASTQTVEEAGEEAAAKVMPVLRRELPRLLPRMLGLGVKEGAEVAGEKAVEGAAKAAGKAAGKSGAGMALYVTGFTGLIIGSIGYALLNRVTICGVNNEKIQGWMVDCYMWWTRRSQQDAEVRATYAAWKAEHLQKAYDALWYATNQEAQSTGSSISPLVLQRFDQLKRGIQAWSDRAAEERKAAAQ